MSYVVDAQLRLQFFGRDAMLPSVVAGDPAHDPNAFPPVESLKGPDRHSESMGGVPARGRGDAATQYPLGHTAREDGKLTPAPTRSPRVAKAHYG